MKKYYSILSILMLWSLRASAQVAPSNDAGVAMAQVHAIVRDMGATKNFWIMMGGKPVKVDGVDVMKFPGVLLFLTQGEPSGGSSGTPVDHVGFWLSDGMALLAKLKAAGVKMDPGAGVMVPGFPKVGNVYSPDDLKVELMEGKRASFVSTPANLARVANLLQSSPTVFDHIHYAFPVPEEAQAWYGKMFGATPSTYNGPTAGANNFSGVLPGTRLLYQKARTELVPTKGRALDRIGFEVKDLQALCKKLEANGVKLDAPYSKTRHKGFASAEITDPWGTSIELTEGLNKF